MAATHFNQLKSSLQSYIDGDTLADDRLKNLFQQTSGEAKFRALMDLRGKKHVKLAGLGAACQKGHLGFVLRMLQGFTADQVLQVARLDRNKGCTALFEAVDNSHPEIATLLLDRLTADQVFELLSIGNTTTEGNSVLLYMVRKGQLQLVQHVFKLLPLDQLAALLKPKLGHSTATEILSTIWAFEGLQLAKDQGPSLERRLTDQKVRHEMELRTHREKEATLQRELDRQNEKVRALEAQIVEQKTRHDAEILEKLSSLERILQHTVATND